MKILRVTSLGYEGGGAENGMILLEPVLKEMGHEVKVFSSDKGKDKKHFNDYSFKALSKQPFLLRIFYNLFYPNSFLALRKVLKEYKPDIVQIHTMYELSPSVLFLLHKYPTVLTVHGAEDFIKSYLHWSFPSSFFINGEIDVKKLTFIGKLHYWYRVFIGMPIYKIGLRNVNKFVVFSEYMKKVLKNEGIDAVCVKNATKLFEEKPLPEKNNTILYVGRLEKIKGVQYVIKAVSFIKEKNSDIKFVIAGTGEYEEELKKLVNKMRLENNVKFLGRINREDLYDEYKKTTLVVVPSVWPEPFGKVGIEAMSVGRPVVATCVGGILEWLKDGETGYLVKPQDPQDLAEKIIRLLNNKELLEKMSQNAVKQAKEFSIQKHADRILEVYNNIQMG